MTIVVGVDGSEASKPALAWAREEARLRGERLVALHAWTLPFTWYGIPAFVLPEAEMDELKAESVRLFEQTVAALEREPAEIERRVVEQVPTAALLEASENADLLVVGARGRGGFAELLLGSVSYACAQRAACPVAIVHAAVPAATGRPIVVGVDGSAPSLKALRWAAREAQIRDVVLRAIHAVELPPPGWPGLDELAAAAEAEHARVLADAVRPVEAAVPVERAVSRERAATALLRAAHSADLLVVGSRGRGGVAGLLLGSVSHQCTEHAACPVVVVR